MKTTDIWWKGNSYVEMLLLLPWYCYSTIVQLKGPMKIIQYKCLTTSGINKSYRTLLRALSKCLLNTDWHGTSTTSLGSMFQCLKTFMVQKCNFSSSYVLLFILLYAKLMVFRLCKCLLNENGKHYIKIWELILYDMYIYICHIIYNILQISYMLYILYISI